METDSDINKAKINWLCSKGYVIRQITGNNVSYFITEKGKEYLNDKE